MLNAYEQILLSKKIRFLCSLYKTRFSKKIKKKISFFLGPTSSFLQFIENDLDSIHITAMPVLDLYTNSLWKGIKPIEITNCIYKYNLLKKRKIIKLSTRSYNLKIAKIL